MMRMAVTVCACDCVCLFWLRRSLAEWESALIWGDFFFWIESWDWLFAMFFFHFDGEIQWLGAWLVHVQRYVCTRMYTIVVYTGMRPCVYIHRWVERSALAVSMRGSKLFAVFVNERVRTHSSTIPLCLSDSEQRTYCDDAWKGANPEGVRRISDSLEI
jgi:hypothetical protein